MNGFQENVNIHLFCLNLQTNRWPSFIETDLLVSESIAQAQNFFKAVTGGDMIQTNRLSEQDFIKKLKVSFIFKFLKSFKNPKNICVDYHKFESISNVLFSLFNNSYPWFFQELGVKADSAEVRDWFRTVDFDSDGLVDFHGWNQLLDDNTKLGEMFRVHFSISVFHSTMSYYFMKICDFVNFVKHI